MLFACPSDYLKDIPADLLTAHRAWLAARVEDGTIVTAGRLASGKGGLIVLRADSEDQARAILAEDPFSTEGVSRYSPMGFTPSMGEIQA